MTVWSIYGQFFGYVRTAFKLESLNRLFFDVRMSHRGFFLTAHTSGHVEYGMLGDGTGLAVHTSGHVEYGMLGDGTGLAVL